MNKVNLPSYDKPKPAFSASPLIILKGVSKVYTGLSGHVQALQDINLHVNPGEFLVIAGKSGAGKLSARQEGAAGVERRGRLAKSVWA